jgi:hypothetical protein
MLDASGNSRRKRHDLSTEDIDIRGNPRAIGTLRLFDSYRLLPFNWMHALVPESGGYVGHRDQCTRMVRAGLLRRFTFNGTKNTSETMTYWRTDAGDRFLHARGFEGLPHDGTHDAHQVLTDLIDAQMQLGTRGTRTRFLNWQDIIREPVFPAQPEHPFRFQIGTHPLTKKPIHLVPDGRPFIIAAPDGRSALFVKELDRNNENPQIIKDKVRNYLTAMPTIKDRYKRKQVMVLFVTTNQVRLQNLMRWTQEVCGGPTQLFLFGFMEDHVKLTRSTAPIVTDLFERPLFRAGHRPYLIKTLSEV